MAIEPETLYEVGLAFVRHYTREGGCGHCGGLPHMSGCFVGRTHDALERAKERPTVLHGKTCVKVDHYSQGYLHDEDDDGPYDVDGVTYCGRCHHWLPKSLGAEKERHGMHKLCVLHPNYQLPCPWCASARLYPCDRCGQPKQAREYPCRHCGQWPNTPVLRIEKEPKD